MKSYSASTFISLLNIEQQQQEQRRQSNENFEHFPSPLSSSSRDLTELNQPLNSITTCTPENSINILEKTTDQTREKWSNSCDYLITTLGGLIGLGKLSFSPSFSQGYDVRNSIEKMSIR